MGAVALLDGFIADDDVGPTFDFYGNRFRSERETVALGRFPPGVAYAKRSGLGTVGSTLLRLLIVFGVVVLDLAPGH
jgi:hypothetical protein